MRIARERPHPAAARPVDDGIAFRDQQPLGDRGRRRCDFFCIAENTFRLRFINGGAFHLRLHLIPRQVRPIRRVHRIAAHVVQALAAILGGFHVSASALVQAAVESPRSGILMHPAVQASEIELLPRLQRDRLPGVHAANLNTGGEPAIDAIGARFIENIREIFRALPPQVVKVPSASGDLGGAAHIVKLPGNHLLCVYGNGMMQAARASTHRRRDRRPARRSGWRRRASAQAAHGPAASARAYRRTAGASVPGPRSSRRGCRACRSAPASHP